VATEDIENADDIRTILKDVWDMRQAKLRKSVDTFIQASF
jgi:GINS complex subunit 2